MRSPALAMFDTLPSPTGTWPPSSSGHEVTAAADRDNLELSARLLHQLVDGQVSGLAKSSGRRRSSSFCRLR